MALNKLTAQISTYSDGYGSRAATLANDGSRNTNEASCAGSKEDTYPWWVVDLGVPTIVCLVKLTNVRDLNGMNTEQCVSYFVQYTSSLVVIALTAVCWDTK